MFSRLPTVLQLTRPMLMRTLEIHMVFSGSSTGLPCTPALAMLP
ncbi:Uncharacterised protein [Mycobacterium tuberculosis]|nr:Uncharacterised protein [Mycobacterium tuberculosis]